jgi:hypothetical protein
LSKFAAAGHHLAYVIELDVFHDMDGRLGVTVLDLHPRAPARGFMSGLFVLDNPTKLRLHSLVLTATGVAAWRETGVRDRIGALDLRGHRQVLDTGPSGTLTDLVLVRGRTAQWRHGGSLRRVRLDTLGR